MENTTSASQTVDTENTLGKKVRTGTIWVFIERFCVRILGFIQTPILAYLLSPSDFGLVGLVTTVMFFVDVFTRTGFWPALVQRKGNIEDYLDAGWTINLIKGFVQLVILLILIGPLASFYHEPRLVSLAIVTSLTTVIGAFDSIRTVILYRKLNLGAISRLNIVIQGVTLVFTVGLAYWLRNVWALALGIVIRTLVNTIGTYVIAPYHPRFDLNFAKARELWSFGKWEFVSGILIAAFMYGDNLFVGKVLGVAALGLYAMAYNLGNIVATELVDSLRRVFFPAFSAIQDDVIRLRKAYLTVYQITATLGAIFVVGLSLLAPEFVHLLFNQKWYPMIPALQVLAIKGGFQLLSTSNAPLFRAVNRPDWFAKVQAVKLALLIIAIYPFSIWWGITGTALAALLASIIEIPIGLLWTRQALECKYWDILVPLLPPFAAAAAVSAMYLFLRGFFHFPNLIHLLVFGFVILISYAIVVLIVDRLFKAGLWPALQSVLKRK